MCTILVRRAGGRNTGDDEILVSAIEEAGATEEYEVQWDSLMTGREAPVVKRQWHLLVKKVRASSTATVWGLCECAVRTVRRDS